MSGTLVAVLIVLIVVGSIAASVVSYFTLQRHRADALALAHYRVFAENATEGQVALREQLGAIEERLSAIEHLLRSVG
jgi:type II secretory pathway pseudopilin PulG